MGFEVRFSETARRRLEDSIAYTSGVLCQPGSARHLYEAVSVFIDELESNPHFLIVDHEASALTGDQVYRKKIGGYRLLFYKDEAAREFVIFSFMHDLQDARAFLMDDYGGSL